MLSGCGVCDFYTGSSVHMHMYPAQSCWGLTLHYVSLHLYGSSVEGTLRSRGENSKNGLVSQHIVALLQAALTGPVEEMILLPFLSF